MKRIIFTVITAVFCVMSAFTVSADDTVNAKIADNNLIIEYSGGSGTAVISYYGADKNLCGAALVKYDGRAYRADLNKSAETVRIWFTDSNEIKTVEVSSPKPTVTPEPEIFTSPTPETAAEVDDFEEEEDNILSICRISVGCRTAVESDVVSDEIKEHLPSDGVMISETSFEITGDMTVLDYLTLAAEEKGLDVDISGSYVRAIGALGEFDGGPLSGWMYRVNGEFLMVPMDGYTVQPDDVIEILYTCNIGNDL